MIDAKIIADSVSPEGKRLTTIEVNFHRFILAELNTHRVFSRNYQSSRAVPIEKMIEQVRDNPAMPVHWGANQSGMQANKEVEDAAQGQAIIEWTNAAQEAANIAGNLNELGVHKQIVNRILEPFIWTKGIITATDDGWESFFKLRCHSAAQPEIRALAELIRERYNESAPTVLNYGMWHTPYYVSGFWYPDSQCTLREAIMISTSCCAQVSYRKLDDSLEKAKRIYERLNFPKDGVFPDDPPHFSPAEHCALCLSDEEQNAFWESEYSDSDIGGNFQTSDWFQLRKMMEQGIEGQYIGV